MRRGVVPTRFRVVPSLPVRCLSSSGSNDEASTRTDRVLRFFRSHPSQIRVSEADTPAFPRMRLVPFAALNHLCLGSIYAWSIFNKPLTRLTGVVAPAADDWVLSDISPTFSLVMGGFVWGTVLSSRLAVWGPRACGLLGALSLGAGFGLASCAIAVQSLPLLYCGGLVWGLSNGLAYVPPVASLLQWFPERKGFASGATLVGYGAGALVAAPAFSWLLRTFQRAPERLGPLDAAGIVTDASGRMFLNGTECVVAKAADLASWPLLQEGLYAVGSGSTGAPETFATLGVAYGALMAMAALQHRLPTRAVASSAAADAGTTTFSVLPAVALRTPQFALLWGSFGLSIMGSYGILSAGATMFSDTTGASAAAAATLVASMSVANLGGRLFWSNASDVLARRGGGDPFVGRRFAYSLMWGAGPIFYGAALLSVHSQPSPLATAALAVSVCAIISSFGGAAATWPAICGDLWGTKHVGVNAARQLSVVMPAAICGPAIVSWLRERGINKAIHDLAALVADAEFVRVFGAGKENLDALIRAKTVTIARLLELAPPGTTDPTYFVYDDMLMLMVALQGAAFVGMRFLRPVSAKFHEKH